MTTCNLCPRACRADHKISPGYCGAGSQINISKVMLHYGEEPYLTSANKRASGAIFFSGCNLKCVYCQNWQISNKANFGKAVTPAELAKIFQNLEAAGAANIDLVTPTHFAPQIIKALQIYKPQVPVIYNCGGYESSDTITKLLPYVDIFLFDLKYFSDTLATKYSKAPNYFKYATAAIKLAAKVKPNIFKDDQMVQGVVIRHMCLPNNTADSINVLDWIASNLGTDAQVSLMSQYTPMHRASEFAEINRTLTPLEYKAVVAHAKHLGLKNTLCQELSSGCADMLPDWNDTELDKFIK